MPSESVTIDLFSDVLCVWAWSSQVRVDELVLEYADRISIRHRFIPVFGAARERITEQWAERDGLAGFNRHLHELARDWSHVTLHPRVWLDDAPASSVPAHLFLKAAQLVDAAGELDTSGAGAAFAALLWRVREAFFTEGRNIASHDVLRDIAHQQGLPLARIEAQLENGNAHAALHLDLESRDRYRVAGSPSYVFNEGRQRLYGNVGYRIISANVRELLQHPRHGEASWC